MLCEAQSCRRARQSAVSLSDCSCICMLRKKYSPAPHLKSLQLPALPQSRPLSSSRLSCTTMSPLQPPSSLQTLGCCEHAANSDVAVVQLGAQQERAKYTLCWPPPLAPQRAH